MSARTKRLESNMVPMDTLTLMKLRDGGFVVCDGPAIDQGNYRQFIFASTSLHETLEYMRSRMSPDERIDELLKRAEEK